MRFMTLSCKGKRTRKSGRGEIPLVNVSVVLSVVFIIDVVVTIYVPVGITKQNPGNAQ
jgi:hypothetical protein